MKRSERHGDGALWAPKRVALAISAAVVLLACPASWSNTQTPNTCAPWTRALPLRWIAPDIAVEDVVFGIPVEGEDSEPGFSETRAVPHVQDQRYGWMMSLHTGRDRVRVREELTLPAPPISWGRAATDPRATLSEDRRRAVVEEETTYDRVQRSWSIDHGDPEGVYTLRLYVEDVLVGEAAFIVGRP